MSDQEAPRSRINTDSPWWRGRGGFWKGLLQLVWVVVRVWLGQQLWGTALRLVRFPAPTKNVGAFIAVVALFLIGWGLWGLWKAFATLGIRRCLWMFVGIYLLFVFVNVLIIPDDRSLGRRLIEQVGQTAVSMGKATISTVQSLLAAPDEFLFAFTGERNMPDLPPGFPTPDPRATPIILVFAAGDGSQRTLRPTPTPLILANATESVVAPDPTDSPASTLGTPAPAITTELTIGGYAVVGNTGGQALIVRSEPGIEHEIVTSFSEGDRLLILDGPRVVGEYTWWRVRGETEEGWCADNWLHPAENR